MRIQQRLVCACTAAALGFGLVSAANAASVSINLSVSYVAYSSPTDPAHPDFYIYSLPFTLPSGYTNAALNFKTLHLDDRGVVQLNGTTVTSSGITNGFYTGQMILTLGGAVVPYTFEHDFSDTVFAPITTGFQTGVNSIDIIVNDTSGGLNFREGLLSGGYYWYTGGCYDGSGCPYHEVRNGITYYRGDINPASRAEFEATVTYDLAAVGETPIPGALPLFATGLAGLGFLAHRRKRKQAA